jgi:ABC-type Fe3+-hydroxamate transport system substrate-binding protein
MIMADNNVFTRALKIILIISSVFAIMCLPAAAIYIDELPCDSNGDDFIAEEELSDAICDLMLGTGALSLDDVGDAAYVYTYWDGEPLTVTDHYNSRDVTLYSPVERIALASTPSVRIIASLGAADRVVGVYQNIIDDDGLLVTRAYPELRDLPSIGSGTIPNSEAIIETEPDVVFYSAASKAAEVQDSTGIPVIALSATFGLHFDEDAGAYDVWRLAGKIIGEEDRAEELVSYAGDQVNSISSLSSSIATEDRFDAYIATGGSNEIIKCAPTYYALNIAGANNVAEGRPSSWGSAEVDKEQIIAWDPGVIFIRYYQVGQSMDKDAVLDDESLDDVSAVNQSRVYYIRGSSNGMDPAIAMADAYRMVKLMYPDESADINVESEGNAIYKEFYGKDDMYSDMLDDFGVFERWNLAAS